MKGTEGTISRGLEWFMSSPSGVNFLKYSSLQNEQCASEYKREKSIFHSGS